MSKRFGEAWFIIGVRIGDFLLFKYVNKHSPPRSLCIMEVNEIFSKYFANYYKITQY